MLTTPAHALRRRMAAAAVSTALLLGTTAVLYAKSAERCTVSVQGAPEPATWRTDPAPPSDPRLHFLIPPPANGPIWLPSYPLDAPGICVTEDDRYALRRPYNATSVQSVSIHVHDKPGDLRFTVATTNAVGAAEVPLGSLRLSTHDPVVTFRTETAKLYVQLLSVASLLSLLAWCVEPFLRRKRRAIADTARYTEGLREANGSISLEGQPNAIPDDTKLPPGRVLVRLGDVPSADYRTAPTPPVLELIPRSREAELDRLRGASKRVLLVPLAFAALTILVAIYTGFRALLDDRWSLY